MKCPYCGTSSGKTDSRGRCASCGGDLGVEGNLPYDRMIRNGLMTVSEARHSFLGVSGSHSHLSDSYGVTVNESGDSISCILNLSDREIWVDYEVRN